MSILDSYTGNSSAEFPFPDDIDDFREEDFEVNQKALAKAPCRKWELLDIRANKGIGDQNKTVVNIRAKGLSDDYDHTGEVAYWINPEHLKNPKHPVGRTVGMLAQMMIALGLLSEEDFASVPADSPLNLDLLFKGANQATPPATFEASLIWGRRAYEGRDGNTYHSNDHEFRYIDKVVPTETPF